MIGLILEWCTLSVKSPRTSFRVQRDQFLPFPLTKSLPWDFLVQPQFPHSVEPPGDFLPAILRIRTSCGWQSTSGWCNINGVTFPFHLLLQDHSCHMGPLLAIPCEGHHLLICSVAHGSEGCTKIRLDSISWQLCHLLLRLHGRLLKSEALFLSTLGLPGKAASLLPPHICLTQAAYVADRHPSTSHQSPGARCWDK